MKIISKKYWQNMKNFVQQISIKFAGFYLNRMNLVQTVLQTITPKYRWKFVYRPIIKRSNIDR